MRPPDRFAANAAAEDREECLASGMDHYLSKPVYPDEIRKVLLQYRATREQLLDAAEAVSGGGA